MRILRGVGALVSAVGLAAVGLAAPASAVVPPVDGYYTFDEPGVPQAKWQMQSICTQPNGTRAQADYTDETIQSLGCNVIISATTPTLLTEEQKLVNVAGRAALTSGLWTMTVEQLHAIQCDDGTTARLTNIFAFTPPDPNGSPNMTGTHTRIHGAVCGMQPSMTKTPFTLTFQDVLDPSVIHRFPMICDYLAGRPSICS